MVAAAVKDRLIVFVKAPRPGAVKTRLARVIGAEAAAALYRVIAEEETRRTAPRGDYDRVLAFDPPDARDEIAAWFPGEALAPQQGADLGARMTNAIQSAFDTGARRVAVIGTDVPSCGHSHVSAALAALDEHDLALGPTHDGGYYLIALDRPRPELFTGIPWSTPSVLPATAERAGVLGLTVLMLDPLLDVDTLDDVRGAWATLGPLLPASLVASLEQARHRLEEQRGG
jgi:rSAM/selenodomain-associated transferase 1